MSDFILICSLLYTKMLQTICTDCNLEVQSQKCTPKNNFSLFKMFLIPVMTDKKYTCSQKVSVDSIRFIICLYFYEKLQMKIILCLSSVSVESEVKLRIRKYSRYVTLVFKICSCNIIVQIDKITDAHVC